jgi:hypothetical protein
MLVKSNRSALSASALVASLLLLSGCANDPMNELSTSSTEVLSNQHKQMHSSFMDSYLAWKGTPYRLGGSTRRGIDCSAFVQQVYQEFGQRYPNSLSYAMLPRTTGGQWEASNEVSNSQVQVGDLVFFRTGVKQRHVGVYMGSYEFLHASTSKGVIISSLTTPYWRQHFESFRRPGNR